MDCGCNGKCPNYGKPTCKCAGKKPEKLAAKDGEEKYQHQDQ